MPDIYIGSTNLYYLFFYFIIFSFLGWLMETVRVSLKNGQFVNRGFANGPYCPIYGFGMCFVIVFLSGLKSNIPALFMCGMLLTTALEYFTSYMLEMIFKAKWWDYSYKKFNLKGRICLDISIAWGILSVIMIELVVPLLDIFIGKIPIFIGEIFVGAVILLIAGDVVSTARSILSFRTMLYKLASVKAEIKEEWDKFSDRFSENMREYVDFNELSDRLANVNIKTQDLKQKLAERRRLIKDLTVDELKNKFTDKDFTEEKLASINKIRNMYARYTAIKKVNISKTHKRILGAFPGFHLNNDEIQEIIKNIKDNIRKK